jgi:periplasmic divalent cation tolerance protein
MPDTDLGIRSPMQNESDIHLIYATFPDMESGRQAGERLIGARLAACVNMWPGMVSLYRWEGRVEEGEEIVFLAKTTATRLAEAVAAIREVHPYEEPAIVAVAAAGGSAGFFDWIRAETQPEG